MRELLYSTIEYYETLKIYDQDAYLKVQSNMWWKMIFQIFSFVLLNLMVKTEQNILLLMKGDKKGKLIFIISVQFFCFYVWPTYFAVYLKSDMSLGAVISELLMKLSYLP